MNDKVKALIEQLEAPHFLVREKAVRVLMELRAEARDGIPMLIEALNDRSWRVREASTKALGVIGSCISDDELRGEIVIKLQEAMIVGSIGISTTIDAVADIGRDFAIPFLTYFPLEIDKDEDKETRIHIIETLRRLRATDPEAIKALVNALADPQVDVRRKAAKSLVELGSSDYEYLPAFIKASKDEDIFVRGPVYTLLGRLASAPDVIPLLMKALREEEHYQSYVEDGLVEAGSLATGALIEALKDPHVEIRLRAAYTLNRMGAQARDAITALIQALEDPDHDVRWHASDALAKIGIYAALTLIQALNTPNEELQNLIVDTLGKMGVEVVPILIQTLERGDEGQREKIAKALHRLGPEGILEIFRIKGMNPNSTAM